MDNPLAVRVEWYVVFTESGYSSRFMRLLRPGFRHCYAMKKTEGGNFWQIINPRLTYLDVGQVLVSRYPTVRDYAGEDAVILNIESSTEGSKPRGMLCWFNCVEVIKAVLGVKQFFVFTPWQLYNYLRINHGRRIRIKS